MEYLIGMLWVRGKIDYQNYSIIITQRIRQVMLWKVEILKALEEIFTQKNDFATLNEIMQHPTVKSFYELTPNIIYGFINAYIERKIGLVSKKILEFKSDIKAWKIIDMDSFKATLNELKKDRYYYTIFHEYIINNFERYLKTISKYEHTYTLDQNNEIHYFSLNFSPYFFNKLIEEYGLPKGAGEVLVERTITKIPDKIKNGSEEEKLSFLRGVMEVASSLEGNIPNQRRNIRLKITLLPTGDPNTEERLIGVERLCNLCNFIQDLGIKVSFSTIRLPSGSLGGMRDNFIKIYLRNIYKKAEGLWNIKRFNQIEFNKTISSMSASELEEDEFGCPKTKKTEVSVIISYLRDPKKIIPSSLRCYWFCPRLRVELKESYEKGDITKDDIKNIEKILVEEVGLPEPRGYKPLVE